MLPNDIFAQYERIRAEERSALLARNAHAQTLHPGFLRISNERKIAVEALSLAARAGGKVRQAVADARAALATLQEEEYALLDALELPRDYLSLRVRCTLCNDTGYMGGTHRRLCACAKKALLAKKRYSSHVNEHETFERFSEHIYPCEAQLKQMLAAKRAAAAFADGFPNAQPRNLLMMGMAGLGKSFLLNSIAARVLEGGHSVEKITAYNLMDDILAGIRGNYNGATAFIRTPLLLIDDLGTEPLLNNLTGEYLFSILNERHNGRMHTVIATNLSPEELHKRYGERIFSRLIGNNDTAILRLTGENLRIAGQRPVSAP